MSKRNELVPGAAILTPTDLIVDGQGSVSLAADLASTSPEVAEQTIDLLRQQGLKVEEVDKNGRSSSGYSAGYAAAWDAMQARRQAKSGQN